jgi:hypothetical protein
VGACGRSPDRPTTQAGAARCAAGIASARRVPTPGPPEARLAYDGSAFWGNAKARHAALVN